MSAVESVDVVVIGSGFGGAIPAYHLAAGGARVVVLERGPWLSSGELEHSFKFGSSATRAFDFTAGSGMSVLGGNCVGGGSVVYFAAMPRPPAFVFERQGSLGRRIWPRALSRETLNPWYDRVTESVQVEDATWKDISYGGGLWGALCDHAGRTANPLPSAVDGEKCVDCNWMMAGCRFDAKKSLTLNYLPAAVAHGAQIRPLHEVQQITREGQEYLVHFRTVDPVDYRVLGEEGTLRAAVVIVAAGAGATPVILQRSEPALGAMPHGVGRYFSGNGERLNVVEIDEERVRSVLGLQGRNGGGYSAFQVGRGPVVANWDKLDAALPEFERYSLEQLYFPPGLGTVLARAGGPSPDWFGLDKKELLARWQSWLIIFEMIEDDNEGVFGPPPPTGNSVRLAQQTLGRGTLRYRPRPSTLAAWARADADISDIVGRDGLGVARPWTNDLVGAYTVHPLSSCRVGDDPATSALDNGHELYGHPGIFVTDGSAVPTALTVNPSMTIAAMAERAVPNIVRRLREAGRPVRYGAPVPVP
ncbi:FAD-dependent oxidoreductase [Kineosporia succinea]|uniref:Cholesterol oxidase n=1 Tax=Kineosporia succinea TaxID=84632 RepID=A0ABT9PAF1_9ACTN|nr:GMC family oxidoreductase [Kineosporia succinea]MDP9829673.1 choline dehydrogenase-like flavoprotein [Kineosporia succinea]